MSDAVAKLATAFDGERRLASGPLIDVAMAVKAAAAAGAEGRCSPSTTPPAR